VVFEQWEKGMEETKMDSERKAIAAKGFANLSNHPVATWGEQQRRAAEALGFGEAYELEGGMPLVAPEASGEDVLTQAREIVRRVMDRGVGGRM
jgi:hypothetical protein